MNRLCRLMTTLCVAIAAIVFAPHAAALTLSGLVVAVTNNAITVGSTTVRVDASTAFTSCGAASTLADLRAADTVVVQASQQADGSLLASSIAVGTCASVTGTISSLAAPSLVVGANTVVTSVVTRYELGCALGSFANLLVGQVVTVQGRLQADGTIAAVTVATGRCTFTGTIESLTTATLGVAGRVAAVDAATQIKHLCGPGPFTDLKVGEPATVQAVLQADGSLLATSIVAGVCVVNTDFATFAVAVEVDARARKIEVNGTFTLGAASNGVNFAGETVALHVGLLGIELPPGSLRADAAGGFRFSGRIGISTVEAVFLPRGAGRYAFHVEVKNVSVTGIAKPLVTTLSIGDDQGQTVASLSN